MSLQSDSAETVMQPVVRSLQHRITEAQLDWIVPEWPAPAHVGAFTTTRHRDQRVRLADLLPSSPVRLKQVHGAAVAVLDPTALDDARASPMVADAMVTRMHDVVCAIATADCLPVLFADRAGNAVGAAHAGWRGLAAGVLEKTVETLVRMDVDPSDLLTWFGPAIGPNAFEVGTDVFDAFCANDEDAREFFAPHREGKWLADIYALARHRLARCGVRDIVGGGLCTYSEPARFHSYRRERSGGRMLTLVWLQRDPR